MTWPSEAIISIVSRLGTVTCTASHTLWLPDDSRQVEACDGWGNLDTAKKLSSWNKMDTLAMAFGMS